MQNELIKRKSAAPAAHYIREQLTFIQSYIRYNNSRSYDIRAQSSICFSFGGIARQPARRSNVMANFTLTDSERRSRIRRSASGLGAPSRNIIKIHNVAAARIRAEVQKYLQFKLYPSV